MISRSFKRVGLHYTAFRNAIREDSRQTTPSRGVTPRKKFAAQANVESRVNTFLGVLMDFEYDLEKHTDHPLRNPAAAFQARLNRVLPKPAGGRK